MGTSKQAGALVIPHEEALRVLLASEANSELSKKVGDELPAVISHWLQSPELKPVHADLADATRWEKVLKEYILRNELNPATPVNKTKSLKKVSIDYSSILFPPPLKPKFTFIDLFAGIGGFRIALQNLGGKCVFSSEWDQHAKETYFNNYGEVPFGDIKKLSSEKLFDRAIDIIAGGFPCQPFSKAGVSARESLGKLHGFECVDQGQLFFDVVKIALIHNPKVLLLENVGNIMRHDGGNTIEKIRNTIENDLKYSFHLKVYNSNTLVPQSRIRCIIVAFRDGAPENWEMPELAGEPIPLKNALEDVHWSSSYTLSDAMWDGHVRRSKRNKDRGAGFTAYIKDINKPSTTLVARYYKDGKECLIPQKDHPNRIPRMLTERECARLQGFPEDFMYHKSKSRAYKQFGNSVPVPLIEVVASSFIERI